MAAPDWTESTPTDTTKLPRADDLLRGNFQTLDLLLRVALDFGVGTGETGHVHLQHGTKAERDAVSTPPEGMPFIRTDLVPAALDVYEGGAWVRRAGPMVGDMEPWSGDPADLGTDRPGWALCDGSTVNGHATLDLSGKFLVGYHAGGDGDGDFDYSGGYDSGGAEDHTLHLSELPSHDHDGGAHDHAYSRADSSNTHHDGGVNRAPTTKTTGSSGTVVSAEGGDQAHENRPQYLALAFICFVDL